MLSILEYDDTRRSDKRQAAEKFLDAALLLLPAAGSAGASDAD